MVEHSTDENNERVHACKAYILGIVIRLMLVNVRNNLRESACGTHNASGTRGFVCICKMKQKIVRKSRHALVQQLALRAINLRVRFVRIDRTHRMIKSKA